MRIAIKIGYNGEKFYGFSMQPNLRTVEGDILKKLIKTKLIKNKSSAVFQYASRTDKGVSAFGNVIAFNSKGNSVDAIGKIPDIWIFGIQQVEKTFNPRYCKSKTYRYYLRDADIDFNKIKKTSKMFVGTHDFSNFIKNNDKNPLKSIDNIYLYEENDVIKIDFEGKSFLWNQIRRIVAALIKIGKDEISKDELSEALRNKKKFDFGIAPAQNLVLVDVKYDIVFSRLLPDTIIIKREIFNDALCFHRN